jgi:hypothetical protein
MPSRYIDSPTDKPTSAPTPATPLVTRGGLTQREADLDAELREIQNPR